MSRVRVLLTALGVAAACSGTPTVPTPLDAGTASLVAWLEVRPGHDVLDLFLEVGDELQLTACARYYDAREECGVDAVWTSDSPAVSVVAGLVRAEAAGRARVTAEYGGESAYVSIMSWPPGVTEVWTLSGSVFDSRRVGAIRGATVSVRGGLFDGVSDVTGFAGYYRLLDVAGRLQIVVEADGYKDETVVVDVGRNMAYHFYLTPTHD